MSFLNELKRWEGFPPGHIATTDDLCVLITFAERAVPEEAADDTIWARLQNVLMRHGPFSGARCDVKGRAKEEVHRARLLADLGEMPKNPIHFLEMFVASRGIGMAYNGVLRMSGQEEVKETVAERLTLFCSRHNRSEKEPLIAFNLWLRDQKRRLLKEAYERLAFLPGSDTEWSELRKFVEVLVADTGEREETARLRRGAAVALAQFIWRVKNHIRGNWQHQSHLMPILYGPTGSGKTTAIKHLLNPLIDMHVEVDFNVLEDGSMFYEMSTIPVMVFEEMAGASKSDVNKIKAVMHANRRQMRQLYNEASAPTMMSTFIGCSNKDISVTIMDETSNRRFFQITVIGADPKAIASIDSMKIWRSIDEDAEAPMYANAEDLQIITSIQSTQRHIGPVELWLLDEPPSANKPMKATKLYDDYFRPWCERHDPTAARSLSAAKLGSELKRLSTMPIWSGKIELKAVHNSNTYTFHCDEVDGKPVVRLVQDRLRAKLWKDQF